MWEIARVALIFLSFKIARPKHLVKYGLISNYVYVHVHVYYL
jgi:hypothetical protein